MIGVYVLCNIILKANNMNKILKQLYIIIGFWIGSIINYIFMHNNFHIAVSINLLFLIILQLNNVYVSAIIALVFGLYDDVTLCGSIGTYALLYSVVLYIFSLRRETYKYKKTYILISVIIFVLANIFLT